MDKRRLLSPTGTTLTPLEKKLYQELKSLRLVLQGQPLLIAVSGGIDSVVLLHVMSHLKSRLGYELVCGHINHGVRGQASDQDAKFVAALSSRLKVPYLEEKLLNLKPGASEDVLRRLRYGVLGKMAKQVSAAFIVTAHHLDDLLETRLMRLLQGTGRTGLTAMKTLNDKNILRPFLSTTRGAIESYAATKNLTWHEDLTNADKTKLRNWIRHEWLGVLRRDHPEYVVTLGQSLERVSVIPPTEARAGVSDRGSGVVDRIFNRLTLIEGGDQHTEDENVYSYLRHFAKKRVTAALVKEFKKQLRTKRRNFSFRLAGVDWQVTKNEVTPS